MRQLSGKLAIGFTIWALFTALFHIYTAYFGSFEPRIQRAIHLLLLFPLVFILFPVKKMKVNTSPSIYDWILAVVSMTPSLYLILNSDKLNLRVEQVDELTGIQVVLGTIVVGLVIEACRRAVSIVFAITVSFFFSYIFIAPFLPGMFYSRSYSFERVIEIMYLVGHQGIYGFLTGISSNVLFVFILFASIMLRSGVGQWFMDVSFLLAGKYRGGPAKVAVVSSGLFGSISGSSVSDVYSTGGFSIPMMKKIGYPATKAGAIEAVASAGGPLLPPVMGAGAFIMAEMTGTGYSTIIQSAVLGAIIYYIGVLATVHFEAVSLNLTNTDEDIKINIKNVLQRSFYVIPFVVLLFFLFKGYSPAKSAVYSMGSMFLVWVLIPGKPLKLKLLDLLEGINYAAKSGAVIISALTGAGIIVSVITQTGIAMSMSNIILEYSFGNLWIALILIMIVTLVLGAGIPTTPAYVITATVAGGALSFFNVPILSAHLFVFYFAILADITPPVGVTAFAAANIAESPPMKTALLTPRFAFAGFLVPFVFIANPELLLVSGSSLWKVIIVFLSTALAVVAFSSVVVGYLFGKLTPVKRLFLLIPTFMAITNNLFLSIIGILLILLYGVWDYLNNKKIQSKLVDNLSA